MATSFPSNPVVGQSATLAGSNFVWNGTAWLRITSSVSLNSVNMDALLDVNVSSPPPTTGQVLAWTGTEWKPQNQTATSVVAPKDALYAVVSTLGNDTTGDGSWGNPFQTISKAVATLSHFGTVFLTGGNYDVGTYTIDKIGVNIIGVNRGSRPEITGQIRETGGYGGWVFENIMFSNVGNTTNGSFFTNYNSASNNRPFTFRNCMFTGTTGTRGLYLGGSHGAFFDQCEFFTNANIIGGTTNVCTWKFINTIGTMNFRTDNTGGTSNIIIDGCDVLNVYDHSTGNLFIKNVSFINQFSSGFYFGTGTGSLIIENSSFINRVTDANGLLSKSGTQNYEFYNVILPTSIAVLSGTNTSRNVENTLTLSQLSNVSNTAPTVGQSLKWNGTEWAPSA